MTKRNNQHTIAETVTWFFNAVDAGEWTTARSLLTDPVDVAHGPDPMTLSSEELVSGWRETHAEFEGTHYQLGPLNVELTSPNHATARCDAHAMFVLSHANEATRVINGNYTIDLERRDDAWLIRSIRHDEK